MQKAPIHSRGWAVAERAHFLSLWRSSCNGTSLLPSLAERSSPHAIRVIGVQGK